MPYHEPVIIFRNPPRKKLCELTGGDIPRGMDPDDLTEEACLRGTCPCIVGERRVG